MRWVTRPGVHIDRAACAWLIGRFIDPAAEFDFIADPTLIPEEATPFDMRGVDLGHHGQDCSFETILKRYELTDPVLWAIAEIVHEADLADDRFDAPEAPGLDVIRRGHHYGTVLVDLAGGHRPVDVLLGRDAADFADWLRAHPGVQVICRDRAGGYADGARDGAPDAVQVADRWHLWDNLCRHVERLVAAHHACLPEPAVPAMDDPAAEVPPDPGVLLQWPDTTLAANTRRRYQQVHDLREQGLSMRAIARRLEVNFKTVRRYVRASSVDALVAGGVQVSVLDPFKPYLNDRLADGERNATRLLAEITGQGYTGGYNTLNRYLRPLRRLEAAALAELPPRAVPPAVRKVTGWITGLPSNLDPDTAVRLRAIRRRCPELDAAVKHVAGFARMIKDLSGDENALTKWIGAVDADLPALRSFTAGLRRDLDAVVAGLSLEYSSGAVEGTVNRVKQLKAAMYGRAKPDLLRN